MNKNSKKKPQPKNTAASSSKGIFSKDKNGSFGILPDGSIYSSGSSS